MKKYFMFLNHKWENGFIPVEISGMNNDEIKKRIVDSYMETFVNDWEEISEDDDVYENVEVDKKWGTVSSPYYDTVEFTIFDI